MSICPNCLSDNTFYDDGEYVCLDCDFVWSAGMYPEFEDNPEAYDEGDAEDVDE